MIVCDREYQEGAEKYSAFAAMMEHCIKEYIDIVQALVDRKYLEGMSADHLRLFVSLLAQRTTGELGAIMDENKNNMRDYLLRLDDADQYLY